MSILTSSDFTDIEFPKHKEIVYILYFRENNSSKEIPLYVGESSRGIGRFGDYISANFSAPTDFKVGESIRYLRSLGFDVRIRFKESSSRKNEEKTVINELQKKSRLLNELEGFNYSGANKNDERARIRDFVNLLVKEKGTRKDENNVRKSVRVNPKQNNITKKSNNADSIRAICEELGIGGKTILRKDILVRAKQLGINESSVLPADYCDNTKTGRWSRHKFLHSVDSGKYVLRSYHAKKNK